MQLGVTAAAGHDFAYHDLAPRPADSQLLSPIGVQRHGHGRGNSRTLARNAVDPAGLVRDTYRPSSRAAKFFGQVPLHSNAPGAAGRIVQALDGDSEAAGKFLQTLELLQPFGPGLVRAFVKAVARGLELAGKAAAPPEPAPGTGPPAASGEFSVQLTRLDISLQLFSASSELRSGRNGFSYTQNVPYAKIQVSFLSLSATGSFSQEIDPLQIEIDGERLSAVGLDPGAASTDKEFSPDGGESSLAPGVRAAILAAANRIQDLLSIDQEHTAGADDPSPIVPRPPDRAPAASIRDDFQSLTEGFTPRIRLHL